MTRWIFRRTKTGFGGWVLHEEKEGCGPTPPGALVEKKMAMCWWVPVLTEFQTHGHSDGATTVIVTRDDGAFECPISELLERKEG
jgi:hypothetical protein